MILHQVFTSPFKTADLQDCIVQCQPTDGILLLQDGVYALNHGISQQIIDKKIGFYLLENDLSARGLLAMHSKFKHLNVINDAQWLALCFNYHRVVSWT